MLLCTLPRPVSLANSAYYELNVVQIALSLSLETLEIFP